MEIYACPAQYRGADGMQEKLNQLWQSIRIINNILFPHVPCAFPRVFFFRQRVRYYFTFADETREIKIAVVRIIARF